MSNTGPLTKGVGFEGSWLDGCPGDVWHKARHRVSPPKALHKKVLRAVSPRLYLLLFRSVHQGMCAGGLLHIQAFEADRQVPCLSVPHAPPHPDDHGDPPPWIG